MAHLKVRELICPTCLRFQSLAECCGRPMDHDNTVLFCPICGREIKTPLCCDSPMRFRYQVRNIKKEIFRDL